MFFKGIRNKITLFNTFTLIAFLIIFIFVLIFTIRWSLATSGETYLINEADTIIGKAHTGESSALVTTAFHENLDSSYIIWNSSEGILAQSVTNKNILNEAHEILTTVKNNSFTTFRTDGEDYRVYTTEFNQDNQTKTLQVFQNITAENNMIGYFIFYLVIIGLFGILILIPISFLLAGRSLIPVKRNFDDQKEFIANASHELRSPLTVIQTSLDVLEFKENETIAQNQKWLNNIEIECENMSNLISEMLIIAKADNNRLVFENNNFSLSDLTEEVCSLMSSNAYEKNQELIYSVQPGLDLNGDPDKIRQVIRIFIDNAIKYTPENGTIEVLLEKGKKDIKIHVKDNGIGISKEEQEKIFERFYRCDNVRSRGSGSGLGLNIAQTIISHYNGSIKTISELGKGTEFVIAFPQKFN